MKNQLHQGIGCHKDHKGNDSRHGRHSFRNISHQYNGENRDAEESSHALHKIKQSFRCIKDKRCDNGRSGGKSNGYHPYLLHQLGIRFLGTKNGFVYIQCKRVAALFKTLLNIPKTAPNITATKRPTNGLGKTILTNRV